MSNKSLANICAKHGFPEAVVDAMKNVVVGETNEVTGGIELLVGTDVVISSGTAAPNDADGKPDGSIYFQI